MEPQELRADLSRVRTLYGKAVAGASRLVKGVLILGGAAIAGAAQFWTWKAGAAPDTSQVIGIAATLAVAIGGLFVLLTERDAAEAIGVAEDALDHLRQVQSGFDELQEYFEAFDKLAETYQLCLTLRGAIEQSGLGTTGGVDGLVETLFELASRPVAIACGFDQADRWTLGVYKAVPAPEPGRSILKAVAQERAIKCTLDQARTWPEGVGIAGIAYLNNREVVIPDLRAEGMGAVFGPRGRTRAYDAERYVSMVAVPIKVAGRDKPWGVVNATSDRPGHFAAESRPGFKTDEPVRTLAAFIALAVAMVEARDRAHSASAATVSSRSTGTP